MSEYKVIITGTMGVGKTTAIAAISDIAPVSSDVLNTDISTDKLTTTVGYDYGELQLSSGDRLRIYGTPGQERFAFMWKILAQGALGLVILVDNSRPDPIGDLDLYLNNFAELIANSACVIGVTRLDTHPLPDLGAFSVAMEKRGQCIPLIPVDIRSRSNVATLLELLMIQLEVKLGIEYGN